MKNLVFILVFCILLQSCGTILKKSQRNQPNSGKIDVTVLTLDLLGMLLVFPGIISLYIDTVNGTIFLPLKAM